MRLSRRALRQIGLVLAAVAVYELARRLIAPDWPLAEHHARDVLGWERALHLDGERSVQRAFLPLPGAMVAFGVLYLGAQFAGTGAFLVWLYRRPGDAYRRFRDALLVATALALVVQWRFPVAPPRLAGVGVEDSLLRFLHLDIGSRTAAAPTDPVAAMPSLHAGWALAVGLGLMLYARSRVWRAVGAVYPLAVVLATVVTGNHFVLDTVAGFAATALGFWLAGVIRVPRGATLATATRGGAVR